MKQPAAKTNGPFLGQAKALAASQIAPEYLSDCSNVIVKGGRIYPRPGYTRKDINPAPVTGQFTSGFPIQYAGASPRYVLYGGINAPYITWTPGTSLNSATTLFGGAASFSAHDRATFMQVGDWVVCCNGHTTRMVRITSAGVITDRDAGFAAPTGAPNLSASASGAWGRLSGAYSYRYTFFDQVNGYESAPSPESAHVGCTTAGMIVSPTTALPTGATHYRIYRRKTGDSGTLVGLSDGTAIGNGNNQEDTWRMVAELATIASDTGTAQAGAASSITLRSGASATGGIFVDHYVLTTAGTGAGQTRKIASYNGGTKVATVTVPWTVVPDNTTQYVIVQDNRADGEVLPIKCPLNNYQPHSSPNHATRSPEYCCYHQNRAYYAATGNVVWYSELPDPQSDTTAFPSAIYVGDRSFFPIPTNKSEYITGLASYGAVLLVFTNERTFAIDTSQIGINSVVPTMELPGAPGCVSMWTVQKVTCAGDYEGMLLWMSKEGVVAYDGTWAQNITLGAVGNDWNSFTAGTPYYAAAFIEPVRRMYVISDGVGGLGFGSLCFSLDDKAWTKWTKGFWFGMTIGAGPSGYAMAMVGNSVNQIDGYTTPTYTDAGSNFNYDWTTPQFTLGEPTSRKAFSNFRCLFEAAPSPAPTVVGYRNGSATPTVPQSATLTVAGATADVTYAEVHFGVAADRLAVKVSGSVTGAASYVGVLGYSLDGEVKGRA